VIRFEDPAGRADGSGQDPQNPQNSQGPQNSPSPQDSQSPRSRPGATGPSDSAELWSVTASDTRFSGRVVSVRSDRVRAASGEQFTRDVVVHPGAVAIVAVDEADRVVVVHQYRHPVGQRLWEVPAGLLDVAGEDPAFAAARELAEETHLAATDWRVLADPFTSPGMTTEAIRVYLARGLSVPDGPAWVGADEEADMPVSRVPLADLVDGVLAGRLHNPALVTGVLAAWVARTQPGWDSLRRVDAPWPVWPVPTPRAGAHD